MVEETRQEASAKVTFDANLVPIVAPFARCEDMYRDHSWVGMLHVIPTGKVGAHLVATDMTSMCVVYDPTAQAVEPTAIRLDDAFVQACQRKSVSMGEEYGQADVELPDEWQPGRVVAFAGTTDTPAVLTVEPLAEREDDEVAVYDYAEFVDSVRPLVALERDPPQFEGLLERWRPLDDEMLIDSERIAALASLGKPARLRAGFLEREDGSTERHCLQLVQQDPPRAVALIMGMYQLDGTDPSAGDAARRREEE